LFHTYQLYSDEEVKGIRSLIDSAEWKPGQARTPELTQELKHNEELAPSSSKVVEALLHKHAKRLVGHTQIIVDHILYECSPPKFNRYRAPSGNYGRHTDSPFMHKVRSDLSCTTFLSDPSTYEGGELNVEDGFGNVRTIKGKPGECVVYPCGQPHWVSPVTKGERIGLVCWLSSKVQDLGNRQLLAKFCKALKQIDKSQMTPEMREVWTDLAAVHAALYRQWSSH
jgi:PKHD-type hydroxylase